MSCSLKKCWIECVERQSSFWRCEHERRCPITLAQRLLSMKVGWCRRTCRQPIREQPQVTWVRHRVDNTLQWMNIMLFFASVTVVWNRGCDSVWRYNAVHYERVSQKLSARPTARLERGCACRRTLTHVLMPCLQRHDVSGSVHHSFYWGKPGSPHHQSFLCSVWVSRTFCWWGREKLNPRWCTDLNWCPPSHMHRSHIQATAG